MTDEYRAIVRAGNGKEVPYPYSFAKPDVNWGGYFHDLLAHQVVRWERRIHRPDGSTTRWVEARND